MCIYIYIHDRKRILEVISATAGCRCDRPYSEFFQCAKVVSVKYVQPQKAVRRFCAAKGGFDMFPVSKLLGYSPQLASSFLVPHFL